MTQMFIFTSTNLKSLSKVSVSPPISRIFSRIAVVISPSVLGFPAKRVISKDGGLNPTDTLH